MGSLIDLTGQVFGKLTVVSRVENSKNNKVQYLCRCACGSEKIILSNSLLSMRTRSCGCLRSEREGTQKELVKKHTAKNRLYRIWVNMHYRCESTNATGYDIYGGRGITVCPEWSDPGGFDRFCEWAVSHGYTDDLQIDRIDVNGNYEPLNCRWVTPTINAINRRGYGPSGYAGVYQNQKKKSWIAHIKIGEKDRHLGSFKTKEEAIEARKRAELELGLREE